MGKYILVGASPPKSVSLHPGGALALSIGLIDYARKQGHDIQVINTSRSGLVYKPILRRIKLGFNRVFELFQALRGEAYDGVIVFSGAGLGFYERILLSGICRWFGVNDLFVIIDGWFFDIRKAALLKRIWIGLLLKIPHKLVASGSRWSELFKEFGVKSNHIARIHYWLPESFVVSEVEKKYSPGRPLRFVFVGWMIKEKGIHEILAAIEELRKKYVFSFTFIGGGTLLEYVRQKVHESGWSEDVLALGWISDQEFQQILSLADVFVLPSYAEGFPMSLIEAFAMGLPAICTDVGGISDSLHDCVNGYLILPRQVQPLVDAMTRYLADPQIVADHSRAALRIFSENHNADTNCELFLDALK